MRATSQYWTPVNFQCNKIGPRRADKAIYIFFPAEAAGNDVKLFTSDGTSSTFKFGRQTAGDHLCLSDYVLPQLSDKTDYTALFVTNIGPGVRNLAEEWNEKGDLMINGRVATKWRMFKKKPNIPDSPFGEGINEISFKAIAPDLDIITSDAAYA